MSDNACPSNPPAAAAPRKVCHLSSAHKWYDERIFQKECKSLARAGYDVALVIPRDEPEVIDGVRIVPIPQAESRWGRLLLNSPRAFFLALKEHADVYHFHDPELLPFGLLLKLFGKRVIYDVHEDYQQRILSANWMSKIFQRPVCLAWGCLERMAGKLFDFNVVVDSSIRRKFPPDHTEMITNAPPATFVRTEPKTARGDVFRLVHIGILTRERGGIKMIEAMQRLRDRKIELHLLGAIDEEVHLRIGANTNIICHGRLPWRESQELLKTCDVGLLVYQPTPAHLLFTGEGNTKLFEYMGASLPIVYADLPGLRWFMETTKAGCPVDPTSAEAIAEAIARLSDDAEMCRTLGENGRVAVRDRFNWDMEEKKLAAVYERVLAPKTATKKA